jgi:hypothetical protein
VTSPLRLGALLVVAAAALTAAGPAGAARECDGLMVCVSVPGPWVVVPVGAAAPRPRVEYQLACPRGYVVGGLDAELSARGIDVDFRGRLGSPVNPGITTARSAVFTAFDAAGTARAPTFRPFLGCIPAAGGGIRVPTAAGVLRPGRPTVRRVRTVRVRPGSAVVAQGCAAGERLVGAEHAVGFFTKRPPTASLVASVHAARSIRAGRVAVSVRADAELEGVRAVVQVQAVCARAR